MTLQHNQMVELTTREWNETIKKMHNKPHLSNDKMDFSIRITCAQAIRERLNIANERSLIMLRKWSKPEVEQKMDGKFIECHHYHENYN